MAEVDQEFIRVDSRQFRAALKEVDAALPRELRKAGKAAADIVAEAARHRAPGRLAASIASRADQTSASVKGGGARYPYFGFIDFGNIPHHAAGVGRSDSQPREFIKRGRIIYPALSDQYDRVIETYERGVAALMHDAGLT